MSDPASMVTAVVLNWCNERDTVTCVRTLLAQRPAAPRILIVDNASPDDSGARIASRFPDLPYLQTGTNGGYAGGNNAGIEWALAHGSQWVLVLNNDTECEPSMIAELLAAAERHARAGALSPWIGLASDPTRPWFAGGRIDITGRLGVHEQYATECLSPFLSGCAMLLRADVLRTVGAFDESFGSYVEDVDLCWRIAQAGWACWYVPSARMTHKAPAVDVTPTPRQIALRDRNRRRFASKHLGAVARLRFSAWFYATRLLLATRYLLAGDAARTAAIARGAFGR